MGTKERRCLYGRLDINDNAGVDKDILKPFNYHTSDPNEYLRLNLLKLVGQWFNVPEDKLDKITRIINYSYSGTIMIDDIQDRSLLRRCKPTAYTLFGIPRTVLTADWTYACIMELLEELDNMELVRAIGNALPKQLAGQGIELYWRENNICPTEEEYFHMVSLKDASVFTLVGKVLNILSDDKFVDCDKLLRIFSKYFQLNDDSRILYDQQYIEDKGFAEDITEGKFGFPFVHAIHNFPEEGKILKEILKSRTNDVEEKKRAIAILEKCGSLEYTKKRLEELRQDLLNEIDTFGDHPLLQKFLEVALPAYLYR